MTVDVSGTVRHTGIPRSTIHQLRTPLTSIRGYAQLLQRGVRRPDQAQRAYATIQREAERLAAMLSQIARVTEVHSGALELHQARIDLGPIVDQAVHQAGGRWPDHVFGWTPGPPTPVLVDPIRIGEVLAALLDNAATFSEPGSRIEVSLEQAEGEARVMVRDAGIGIPAPELEQVFDCFQRGSNVGQAGPSASQGLGIGLFVARAIAVRNGGRLWAEAEHETGATVYLALPLDR